MPRGFLEEERAENHPEAGGGGWGGNTLALPEGKGFYTGGSFHSWPKAPLSLPWFRMVSSQREVTVSLRPR